MTRLRELIEESGLMQKDVADSLGWPHTTFGNYVRNVRELDHAGICKVCDYFGCTADYLLGRSDNRYPSITEKQAAMLQSYENAIPDIQRAVDGLLAPYAAAAEEKNA